MSDSQEDTGFGRLIEDIRKKITAEEEALYSSEVLKEYRRPKNVGKMKNPDACASIKGPCGDTMEFYLKVEGGRARRIEFMTDGCGPTIACGSRLTQMAEGKTLEEIGGIEKEDLVRSLDGLPEENLHCAELSINTLRKALKTYVEEKGQHHAKTQD